ncbi:S8 family peptidase [Actinokineospora sp. NPDC004072]
MAPSSRRRGRALALLALTSLGVGVGAPGGALADPPAEPALAASPNGIYLVELADAPVVEYGGGVAGLAATAPEPGGKLDRDDPDVRSYVAHLDRRRAQVLGTVRGARKVYDYNYTNAGFAARMTPEQAAKLAKAPGVKLVVPDGESKLDTVSTPEFLGLTGRSGAWQRLGGDAKAGDGVIIGVIDSGFVPENPSFGPIRTTAAADRAIAARWRGVCDPGVEEPRVTCNNKVIGARYFNEGVGTRPIPSEYTSPRDHGGHGSHTASTAAGKHGVAVSVDGRSYGAASGIAPGARLAIYKTCWIVTEAGDDTCINSDSVKAIDTAIADGVDVLNYSISGASGYGDLVTLAFYRAAKAGVFVAASAGNDGPGASTVSKNTPWMTSVAAGTHPRQYAATVTTGDGKTYTGTGAGAAVPAAPLVLSTAVGLPGANAEDARLCYEGALDPAKAAGKIVVCDRGVNDRTAKSRAVKQAGGIGMVLVNPTANSLNGDIHVVPTVHVDHVAGAAIKAYAAGAAPTAALSAGTVVKGVRAPAVAAFSSRGPALTGGGDFLKPDILAPGVDVLAAVTPERHGGRNWDLMSGTSMAAPHIAGMAALLIQRHPGWSPMAVKSALMTSAKTTDNQRKPIPTDAGAAATPLDYGAGHVSIADAIDTDLVYDSGAQQWDRLLCGVAVTPPGGSCQGVTPIDASDVNLASIAIGDLAGKQTVTRTLTNTGRHAHVLHPKVTGLAGLSASVSPRVLVIPPGQSRSYKVTFTRTSAPLGAYVFGDLTWTPVRGAPVRSVIAVKPVFAAVSAELRGTGSAGSAEAAVQPGFTGTLTASVVGLAKAAENTAELRNPTGANFDTANPTAGEHTAKFTVTVPAGTTYVRWSTFDADVAAGTDLDVFVYRAGTTTLVNSSAGSTAEEWVSVNNPTAGSYDVYVDLYDGPAQQVKQFTFLLGSAAAGNLTATPASQQATAGAPTKVTAAWSGLPAGGRWVGRVLYGDGTTTGASTLVWVNS